MGQYPSPVPPDAFVRLATDLAMEVRTPAETFAEWGLGLPGQDPRTDALLENNAFAEIYDQIQREWEGVKGTTQRVRLKSALMVEEALPAIYRMIMAEDGDHRLRLEAFRQLSKMSGVEEDAKRADSGHEKFVVNIRIGDTVHEVSAEPGTAGPAPLLEANAEAIDAEEVPAYPAGPTIRPQPDPSGFNFNVIDL